VDPICPVPTMVCQDMMIWKPGKRQREPQNWRPLFDVELYLAVHKSFVAPFQLSLLDDYFIIRKYSELDHRAQVDLFPNEQNFDLDKSKQTFHHSLKEHHKISKFRCEML
jgi:hypothetical protein